MIITFMIFSHKQGTLPAVIYFLFVPLVLSLLCVYQISGYIRMLCGKICLFGCTKQCVRVFW